MSQKLCIKIIFIFVSVSVLKPTMSLEDSDDNWANGNISWPPVFDLQKLLQDNDFPDEAKFDLNSIIEKSDNFPIKFPINTTRIFHLKSLMSEDAIEKSVSTAYPLLHEYALRLYASFLSHQKRKFGSIVERTFYENMTIVQLVDRLLTKRAVSFVGPEDEYLLLDGTKGEGGWETIGTNSEGHLKLQNCLSYAEIKLSALLSVSSPTYFINEGDRKNQGTFQDDRSKVEETGIVIGVTGPRLDKEYVMEYREIMKTKDQNTHVYGYGSSFVPTLQGSFLNFYGYASLTYSDLMLSNSFASSNYIKVAEDKYFDKSAYIKRITLTIDVLLIEANKRAKDVNKTAFVHVVGFGLGNWKIASEQDNLFLETFAKRATFLGRLLKNISDIFFSDIHGESAGKYTSGEKIPLEGHSFGGIKIHIGSRAPHQKLTGEDSGKLLVVSYPGNGNALPGNEFWLNQLSASGDSAAASSSQIAELHNSHINPNVRGGNLRIVTIDGIYTFKEYKELHKNDK